jgi:hypothetical protein
MGNGRRKRPPFPGLDSRSIAHNEALGARHSMPLMLVIAQCSGIASAAAENFLLSKKKKEPDGRTGTWRENRRYTA